VSSGQQQPNKRSCTAVWQSERQETRQSSSAKGRDAGASEEAASGVKDAQVSSGPTSNVTATPFSTRYKAITLPPILARLKKLYLETDRLVGKKWGLGSGRGQRITSAPNVGCDKPVPQTATTIRQHHRQPSHSVPQNDDIIVRKHKCNPTNDVPTHIVYLWPHYGVFDLIHQGTRDNLMHNRLGLPAFLNLSGKCTPSVAVLRSHFKTATQELHTLNAKNPGNAHANRC